MWVRERGGTWGPRLLGLKDEGELGTWVLRKEVRGAWTLNSPWEAPLPTESQPQLEPHDRKGFRWREIVKRQADSRRGECGLGVLPRPAGPSAKPLHPPPLQGKFIRINFDVAGYIVGANIETCILSPPRGGTRGRGRAVAAIEGGPRGLTAYRKQGSTLSRSPGSLLPTLCLRFPLCRRRRTLDPQEGAGAASPRCGEDGGASRSL